MLGSLSAVGLAVSTPREKWMVITDHLVPGKYFPADPETLRKARLCVMFSMAFALLSAFFLIDALARGELRLTAVLVVTTTTFALAPMLLRKSVDLCAHLLLVITASNMFGVTCLLVDKAGQTLPWFTVVPVMATLLSGRRAGAIWAVISTGLIAAASLLGARVGTHGADYQGELSLVSLTIANFGMGWIFESTRARAQAVVDEANREMRLVLDHVDQGLVLVDAAGRLSPQRSRTLVRWFGEPRPDVSLWSWINRDASAAQWLEVCWGALFDGMLPVELAVDQLPSRLQLDGRSLRLTCRPLEPEGDAPPRALVMLTDVTAQDEAERAEATQREFAAAMERIRSDREGFAQFCAEATALVRALDPASPTLLRAVHTLKGNCGLFGVRSVVERCHALESRVADTGEMPTINEVQGLALAWSDFADRVSTFIRLDDRRLTVDLDDYDSLMEAMSRGVEHADLREMLAAWRLERTSRTFGRFAEQARALAMRLHRGELQVIIDDGAMRLDRVLWAPLWAAFVHAVRNAVDHGIESPEERVAAGKTSPPTLRLSSRATADNVVIELADDGRGVDWDVVSTLAAARGLPCDTEEDLHDALFFEGLSTRDEVSETSGRGVGLAALRGVCEGFGGVVRVRSVRGRGTTLTVTVPLTRCIARAGITVSTGGRTPPSASKPHVASVLPMTSEFASRVRRAGRL